MHPSLHAASAALLALLVAPAAYAQTAPTPPAANAVNLGTVDINAQPGGIGTVNTLSPLNTALPQNLPAVVEGRDISQLTPAVNAVSTPELLKYLPSIEVRERAIGDLNAIVATRTTGTVSSAETLVYADEQLISNLLGNSYSWPPRWGLVSPAQVQRIDVMYGPFSALYPGNSMGGVVTLTTRMPDKLEAHLDITGALQNFKLYGTDQSFGSASFNAALGDKIGPWSFWASADRLDARGQPLNFATANLSTTTAKQTDTVVSGYYRDLDQNGNPRLVFGAYSMTKATQDDANLKIGYDLSDTARIIGTLGLFTNDADNQVQSFLTTAAGTPFYNGNVNIGGKEYKVSGLEPGQAGATHIAESLALRTDTQSTWDWDISESLYRYLNDWTTAAALYGQNTTGTNQVANGSGWESFDLRGIYRPDGALLGTHQISFGLHDDGYHLTQNTYSLADWMERQDGPLTAKSAGNTNTAALYLQDAWKFLPRWTFTFGGRQEFWSAYGGTNTNASGTFDYPSRNNAAFSPKASLAFEATPDFTLRLSAGRAVRYPTVTELFQQVTNSSAVIINDPALKPEDVASFDLTGEYTIPQGLLRASLFDEERHNALFSQTDTTVTPNVTQIENIGLVRVTGVELAADLHDLYLRGLDLAGGVTLADAHTISDAANPIYVGKEFPRIPEWRLRLQATYHPEERWSVSAGLRYASAAYSTLNDQDINHNTFGGISSYLVLDARATFKITDGVTVAAGVDNLTDCHYYVSPHPYPQTTAFLEAKWDL